MVTDHDTGVSYVAWSHWLLLNSNWIFHHFSVSFSTRSIRNNPNGCYQECVWPFLACAFCCYFWFWFQLLERHSAMKLKKRWTRKHKKINRSQPVRLPLHWLFHGFSLPFVQVCFHNQIDLNLIPIFISFHLMQENFCFFSSSQWLNGMFHVSCIHCSKQWETVIVQMPCMVPNEREVIKYYVRHQMESVMKFNLPHRKSSI